MKQNIFSVVKDKYPYRITFDPCNVYLSELFKVKVKVTHRIVNLQPSIMSVFIYFIIMSAWQYVKLQ